MWEQYLGIGVNLTQEYWPLMGSVMVVLILPLMILRVGRHGRLAAKGIKQLNDKVEELQTVLEGLKKGGSVSAVSEAVAEVDSVEAQKEKEAEKVFEAFAKACQENSDLQEENMEVQEETAVRAQEEFSFDGNLAVEQPEFTPPAEDPVVSPAPQPVPEQPVAVKKDRNVVQCSQCGNKLAYKGEWSGKKVKCPSCKDVLSLP